nr:inorganic diphosphatase [Francisella frigiditurris]
MVLKNIPCGKDIPNDFNVVIEIPEASAPVKYEFCKDSNMIVVDRFMSTTMRYPCNYGFIPNTLYDDGDPIDVLVLAPEPLVHGCVINCRAVGVFKMEDDGGIDAKIIAVPSPKLSKDYDHIKDINDLPKSLLQKIEHFFTHYKDLDSGKWVKVEGWDNAEFAKKEILKSVKNYK